MDTRTALVSLLPKLVPRFDLAQGNPKKTQKQQGEGKDEKLTQKENLGRERESWDGEMEPDCSISAVPNGHMAVWDGREGELGLHLGAPDASPPRLQP